MTLLHLTPDTVRAIHDRVLNPGELTGEAKNKSLEGALSRVDNRIAYGLIVDRFDLEHVQPKWVPVWRFGHAPIQHSRACRPIPIKRDTL